MPTIEEQIQILKRRCERILTEEELRAKLNRSAAAGKPLRIKFGMDPTAPDVTLGHCVPLKVIRQFQEWGHKAVLIIGDYTARIGDPTGQSKTRPPLSGDEIDRNARTYEAQIGKILLTASDRLEVRYNGEWLANMTLAELIKLLSRGTVGQILARDDFAKRVQQQKPIRLHEMLYPMMQGWDSVQVAADIEMGGSDQLFNNLVGRQLQQEDNPSDPLAGQVVIVTPLLVGTDGVKKMSKSVGNYVAVTDPPRGQDGMFGKIMSLPDTLLDMYYTLLTDLPQDQFEALIKEKPRDAKVQLAKYVISWLHSREDADRAEAEFNKIFRDHGVPDDMPEILVGPGFIRVGVVLREAKVAASSSEAYRLIREGAVETGDEKIADDQTFFFVPGSTPEHQIVPGKGKRIDLTESRVMRIGRRRFLKVTPSSEIAPGTTLLRSTK